MIDLSDLDSWQPAKAGGLDLSDLDSFKPKAASRRGNRTAETAEQAFARREEERRIAAEREAQSERERARVLPDNIVGDVLNPVARGVSKMGQTAVLGAGLARDAFVEAEKNPSGPMAAGVLLRRVLGGATPKETAGLIAADEFSQSMQAQQDAQFPKPAAQQKLEQELGQSKGFVDTLSTMLKPSNLGGSAQIALESLASSLPITRALGVIGGAGAASGAEALDVGRAFDQQFSAFAQTPAFTALREAIGDEGIANARDALKAQTIQQTLAGAMAGGALTAGVTAKIGLNPIETAVAAGRGLTSTATKGVREFIGETIEGGGTQAAINAATGRPLAEGVPESAAMEGAAGFVSGVALDAPAIPGRIAAANRNIRETIRQANSAADLSSPMAAAFTRAAQEKTARILGPTATPDAAAGAQIADDAFRAAGVGTVAASDMAEQDALARDLDAATRDQLGSEAEIDRLLAGTIGAGDGSGNGQVFGDAGLVARRNGADVSGEGARPNADAQSIALGSGGASNGFSAASQIGGALPQQGAAAGEGRTASEVQANSSTPRELPDGTVFLPGNPAEIRQRLADAGSQWQGMAREIDGVQGVRFGRNAWPEVQGVVGGNRDEQGGIAGSEMLNAADMPTTGRGDSQELVDSDGRAGGRVGAGGQYVPPIRVGNDDGRLAAQSQVAGGESVADVTQPTQAAAAVDARPPLDLTARRTNSDTKFDERVHDLADFVALNGGLDRSSMEAEGIDPANWNSRKARSQNDKFFGKPLFRKTGGMTLETLREKARDAGFRTDKDVLDLIGDSLGGRKTFTPAGSEYQMALADVARQEADAQARQQRVNALPLSVPETDADAYIASRETEFDAPADRDGADLADIESTLASVADTSPQQRASVVSLGHDYTRRLLELKKLRGSWGLNPDQQEEYTSLLEQDRETGKVGGRPIPGVGNKVAFVDAMEQGRIKPVIGFGDLDNFKAINDKFGHEAGDEVIRAYAEHIASEFPGSTWGRGGDEFLVDGASREEIDTKMARVRAKMAAEKFEITLADGSIATLEGVQFSYGTGATESEADANLKQDKLDRKAAGLRYDREESDARRVDAPTDRRRNPQPGQDAGRGDSSGDAAAEGVGDERQEGGRVQSGDAGNGSDLGGSGPRTEAVRGGQAGSREVSGGIATVRSAISQALGAKFLRRLESQPWFHLVGTIADLPANIRKSITDGGNVAGFVLDNDVYIIADQASDPVGVTLHEVGVHFGMSGILGADFPAVLRNFKRQRAKDAAVGRAYERATEAAERGEDGELTADALATLDEEALAYYVEDNWQAPDTRGIVAKVIDAIKSLLNRLGIPLSTLNASPELLRNVAIGAARKAADGRVSVGKDGALRYHKAWHGSPHDFDKFRLDDSTIGTGEGAQAFGHGLYFAGRRELGEYYRNALAGRDVAYDGAELPKVRGMFQTGIYQATSGDIPAASVPMQFQQNGAVTKKSITLALAAIDKEMTVLDRQIEGSPERFNARPREELRKLIDLRSEVAALDLGKYRDAPKGKLYEVELAPQESDYLDWDAPLSEQSEKVRAGVRQAIRVGTATVTRGNGERPFSVSIDGNTLHRYKSEADALEYANELNEVSASEARIQIDSESATTGKQAYRAISESKGGDREASRVLHAAGIPGIRYLDGSSRGKGEGSRNFVLFDDSSVSVVGKYSRRAANAPALKNVPDGLGTDSKLLSDVSESGAFQKHGLSSFEVPRQRVVLHAVLRVLQNRKVRDAVIRDIPVDVVNVLGGGKLSSDALLDDPAVFLDLLSVNGDKPVSPGVNASGAAIKVIARAAAIHAGAPFESSGSTLDSGSAALAGGRNGGARAGAAAKLGVRAAIGDAEDVSAFGASDGSKGAFHAVDNNTFDDSQVEVKAKYSRRAKFEPWKGTVEAGTVLYHGSPGELDPTRDAPLYLSDRKSDAGAYAAGLIPGTGKGQKGKPQIIKFIVSDDARVLDANIRINDAVMDMTEETADEAIDGAIAQAKREGYDFVWFEHPSVDGDEMNALIAVDWRNILLEDDGDFHSDYATKPKYSRRADGGSVGTMKFTPEQTAAALDESRWFSRGTKVRPSAKVYRGVSERSGTNAFTYGRGLYTTLSKSDAAEWGRVVEVDRDALPSNPIRFDSIGRWQEWEQFIAYDLLKFRRRSEFEGEMGSPEKWVRDLDPTIDGVQIGTGADAFFVKWPPPAETQSDTRQAPPREGLGASGAKFSRRTITIDGTERPTTDSTGKAIHPTEEGVRKFWRWFGESVATDSDGAPLVVYHGTPDGRFMKADDGVFMSLRDRYHERAGVGAFWFAKDRQTAASYADDRRAFDYQRAEPATIPAYIKLTNPLIVEGGGKEWREAQAIGKTTDVIEKAQAEGHDGVIIRNVRDNYNNGPRTKATDTYVVFESAQIKHAEQNSGAFSPTDKRIAYSRKTPADARAEAAQKQADLGAQLVVSPGQSFVYTDQFTGDWRGQALKMRERVQDKLLSVRNVQQDIEKIRGAIQDAMNVYRRENLMHGRVGDQRDKLQAAHVKPLIEAMAEAKVSPALLEDYLEARHAKERNEKIAAIKGGMPDGASGMTTAQAEDFLQGRAAGHRSGVTLDPAMTRQVSRLGRKVYAITAETRRRLLDSGQITQEAFDALESAYAAYVPLRGKDGTEGGKGRGTGKGIDVRGKPVLRAAGRGEGNRAQNILAEVIADAERSIINAEKLRVGRTLARLVLENPNPDVWAIEPVKTELKVSDGTPEEIYEAVKNLDQEEGTIIVKVKGKPYRIVIEDQRMADALKNMAVETVPEVIQYVAGLNRYFSAVLTRYNPSFVGVNMTRDLLFGMTGIWAEHGTAAAAKAAASYFPAMRAAWRDIQGKPPVNAMGRYAREFAEAGGKTYFGKLENVSDMSQRIGEEFKTFRQMAMPKFLGGEMSPVRALAKVARDSKMVQAIEAVNDTVENTLRLSVYAARREAGASIEQAAEYAKNISVNFNRRGSATSWLNALYLFFNAATQGAHRTLTLLKNPKVQGVLGGLAALQATSAMFLMGLDDEDGEPLWDSISPWDKQRNLILAIPIKRENGWGATVIKIPMPYGFNLFPYMGGRSVELARDLQEKPVGRAIADYTTDAVVGVAQAMSPIPFDDGWKAALPHWVRIFTVLSENKDDLGIPIRAGDQYDSFDKPRSASGRDDTPLPFKIAATALNRLGGGDDYTPPYAKFALDWAPEDLAYLFKTFAGGLGSNVVKTGTLTEKLIAGVPVNFKDVPALSSFVSNVDQRQATSTRYYDHKDDIEREVARQRDLAKEAGEVGDNPMGIKIARNKSGAKVKRGEGYELEGKPGSLFDTYKQAEKDISRIRDEMRAAFNDQSISYTERIRKIDELKAEREEVQRELNAAWREQRKKRTQ